MEENKSQIEKLSNILSKKYDITRDEVIAIYSYLEVMNEFVQNNPDVTPIGCLNSENEEDISLVKKNGIWHVFTTERGEREDHTKHKRVEDAIKTFIRLNPYIYEGIEDADRMNEDEKLLIDNFIGCKEYNKMKEYLGEDVLERLYAVYLLLTENKGSICEYLGYENPLTLEE